MDRFQDYMKQFDLCSRISQEEIEKTQAMLQLYVPILRIAANSIGEMEEECLEGHRQALTDFIDLAVDFDQASDRKRIADRLEEMGHSIHLLSIMEQALILVKSDPSHGKLYYDILRTRYFDAYCTSNEDAFLTLGISSSTYYRHIKKAIHLFAANLWYVVIPDMIIAEHGQSGQDVTAS